MRYVTDTGCVDVIVRRLTYDLCVVLGNREVPGLVHCTHPWTVWLATVSDNGVLRCRDGRYFSSHHEAEQAMKGVTYGA